MTTTALVGGTGLVGSHILNTLLHLQSISRVEFLARRPPRPETISTVPEETQIQKLSTFISTEPAETWASHIRKVSPAPQIFFSSIATTRASAGGFAPQYALEHDANLAMARAAKENGTQVYVLISSVGADKGSRFPYLRMKGDVEDSIVNLGFDKTVIVRPNLITGQREETRFAEGVMRGVADMAGWVSKPWLKDWWAQDAGDIAKAAVSAGVKALEGKAPEVQEKVWIMTGEDIIRLGRTEWEEK
ncbi:hypothetical protein AJ80_00576 [Polytolypa hystricis UAMH7299]|uniref:Uncharacterized protein n=1 Tax=Polytolypa hystricis (strain UAMH7299) TaxID=1447883 RepID=A0A2B7Z3T2_POLH7|nr:hypothetical protein AJ80_00576 [Polytolypa hystricis UAMH7299]